MVLFDLLEHSSLIIVLLQLISTGFSKYPTFISPVNILEHPAAGRRARHHRGVDDHGHDLGRHRPVGRHVGLPGLDRSVDGHLALGLWRRALDPRSGVAAAIVLETMPWASSSRSTRIEPFIITLGGMISFQGIALLLSNSREVVMKGELDFLTTNLLSEGIRDPVTGLILQGSALCADLFPGRTDWRVDADLYQVRPAHLRGGHQLPAPRSLPVSTSRTSSSPVYAHPGSPGRHRRHHAPGPHQHRHHHAR